MNRTPVTVSQLSREIKLIVEDKFMFVFVMGEISNFKHHSSGHFYFTLKDEKSQISANMWSSRNWELNFTPENGMKVLVKGRITLYESRGSYQIDVFEMEQYGAGELQVAFEKLKRKLYDEGLFDQIHKKSLPEFPGRVGVITSESGAAYQDFIKVTRKRFPFVKLTLFEAKMQGAGAAFSIRKALRKANMSAVKFDILVISRGGGSTEDLWCFNDEELAREIFKSEIPVVSAVGHEIDFTICDLVSDLRAPTPSAAAEMIFPDKSELHKRLIEYSYSLENIVKGKFENLNLLLKNISTNYYFNKPLDLFNQYKYRLDEIDVAIEKYPKEKLIAVRREIDSCEKLLNSLNPDQVLKRGYTIVMKENSVVGRKKGVNARDRISIKFYDGKADAEIL